MSDVTEDDRRFAKLVYDALAENGASPYMGPFDISDRIIIDGEFDFVTLARVLRQTLCSTMLVDGGAGI